MPFEVPDLRDEVVVLRLPTDADIDAITTACQDPEISRFTRVPSPYSRDDAAQFIERTITQWREGVTAANFVIEDAATCVLAGACGLDLREQPEVAEIGYWIAPDARRRGIATRAARLVSRWALATFPILRLELMTHPDNEASQRVAERAGFTREGLLRSYATIGCGISDVVMFSLLPTDL